MRPITELQKTRLLLVAIGLVSLIPISFHHFLSDSRIYEIRYAFCSFEHSDLRMLRQIGQLSSLFPFIIGGALVTSALRPSLTRSLLAVSTAVFVVFLLLFLCVASVVIVLNVPIPKT